MRAPASRDCIVGQDYQRGALASSSSMVSLQLLLGGCTGISKSVCLIIPFRPYLSCYVGPLLCKERRILLKIHDNSERSLAVNLPFVAVW